tara:strand:+ start:993 stop:1622 length:630 start_codon:yes stop_codon:yes gene_type:complete
LLQAEEEIELYNCLVFMNDTKFNLLLKDCANGFYQQMYFLGKDVIHLKGNQLQAYGFVKSPSRGLKGTSCYNHESSSRTIKLYGSCAGLYTDLASVVFLRKRCRFYRWVPKQRLVAGKWSQADIQLVGPDAMYISLVPLLRWWVAYEGWVEERLGKMYRELCFAEWSKVNGKAIWLPPIAANEWVKQFLELRGMHVRPKQFVNGVHKLG